MAEINLKNVRKCYANGYVAVESASLSVADGEFLVLVGPSGCGKSTTLRMIAGLEEVSGGELFIGGKLVNHVEPGDRDIAMVFQNYALYPHMTVRQNMSFGLKMRNERLDLIDQRIDEAARILSIEPLLDRKPRELSGGQRQRVAVGRAIVRKPAAFLFDEPLSNLDAKLRVQMRTELARLHQQLKTTTIYVTHDQVEAMTLGDRIVVMKDGIIQQVDQPLNLYHFPTNRFVASFIGSPAMNFLTGRVSEGAFECNDVCYRLDDSDQQVEQQPAVFGFRPEDITLDESEPMLGAVNIDVIERMGHETILYFKLDNSSMVGRVGGDAKFEVGDSIPLRLPRNKWHLFETGDCGSLIARGVSLNTAEAKKMAE
ncbi:MAG: sn-glycerol-3-phosphate ABC transporter ATP-binding protein UgpC [Planctomycetota bacterium]